MKQKYNAQNVARIIIAVSALILSACQKTASTTKSSVTLTAESTIFGSGDTGNKSTLKKVLQKTERPGDINIYHYDEDGKRVPYDEGTVVELDPVTYAGEAILSLGSDVDDTKIDSSAATVTLANGDGYVTDELILHADKLDGAWKNGEYHYQLQANDLEWNMGDYPLVDENSGREWSCFGGDGNGYYTFTLNVSGIKYDGVTVNDVQFPVSVYIWGRDATDMAGRYNDMPSPVAQESSSNLQQSDEVQWVSDSKDEPSIICDETSDNFYVVWSKKQDGSNITKDDVTITLENEYGSTYTLDQDQYEVYTKQKETQIALTFQHWPNVPVYDKLSINVVNNNEEYTHIFDVASVYAYMVQQGGGGVAVDGTVVAYSFYGIDNYSLEKMTNPAVYTLSMGRGPQAQYYAEDNSGNGYLTNNLMEAKQYDAQEAVNPQLVASSILVTNHPLEMVDVNVDGQTVSLAKTYMPVYKSPKEMIEAGVTLKPGFTVGERWGGHDMWSWQNRFLSGWTPDKPAQTTSPYGKYPYGKDVKE